MSKPSPVNPTAAQVRAFFRANEGRLARLSEAAQHTVNSRGRLHPEVFASYNKGRKPERQYVLGATSKAVQAKAAQRKALADSGVAVGKRGPLSKVAQAALSEA